MRIRCVVLIGLLAAAPLAFAQIHKCTDAVGRVAYQDVACARGERAAQIDPVPAPTAEQIAAAERVAFNNHLAALSIRPAPERVYVDAGPLPPRLTSSIAAPEIRAHVATWPAPWADYQCCALSYRPARVYHGGHDRGPFRPRVEPRASHAGNLPVSLPAVGLRPR